MHRAVHSRRQPPGFGELCFSIGDLIFSLDWTSTTPPISLSRSLSWMARAQLCVMRAAGQLKACPAKEMHPYVRTIMQRPTLAPRAATSVSLVGWGGSRQHQRCVASRRPLKAVRSVMQGCDHLAGTSSDPLHCTSLPGLQGASPEKGLTPREQADLQVRALHLGLQHVSKFGSLPAARGGTACAYMNRLCPRSSVAFRTLWPTSCGRRRWRTARPPRRRSGR